MYLNQSLHLYFLASIFLFYEKYFNNKIMYSFAQFTILNFCLLLLNLFDDVM